MSQTPASPPALADAADPSMEDILASIRRILNDGEGSEPAGSAMGGPIGDDVFVLDRSMMIDEPEPSGRDAATAIFDDDDFSPPPLERHEPPTLMAPQTVDAASQAVGTLVRALHDRQMPVHRGGGPTLEDIVREEMRPLVKSWLDEHLPPLVERLVRAEIERLVGRAAA